MPKFSADEVAAIAQKPVLTVREASLLSGRQRRLALSLVG